SVTAPVPNPDSAQVRDARCNGLVRTLANFIPLSRSPSRCALRSPSGVRGRSVRPVCWPERVHAVFPCRAIYTTGSTSLMQFFAPHGYCALAVPHAGPPKADFTRACRRSGDETLSSDWRKSDTEPAISTFPPDASACRAHLGSGMRELPAFRRNGPVFFGPNHEHTNSRICGRNVAIESGAGIQFGIKFQTEKFQCAARCRSHIGGILANPSSEDQRLHSSQHGRHAANRGPKTVDVDVECQLRSLVTLLNTSQDVSHVAREA